MEFHPLVLYPRTHKTRITCTIAPAHNAPGNDKGSCPEETRKGNILNFAIGVGNALVYFLLPRVPIC